LSLGTKFTPALPPFRLWLSGFADGTLLTYAPLMSRTLMVTSQILPLSKISSRTPALSA
jgi:hypothetical protein